MLEDIFITQPQIMASKWLGKRGITSAVSVSIGIGTGIISNTVIHEINTQTNKAYRYLEHHPHLLSTASGAAFAIASFVKINTHFVHRIEREQLEQIIESWPCTKTFFPKTLHICFDTLSQQYQNHDPAYDHYCDETLRLIKSAIYEHFPRKYAKKSWTDFFSEKSFNIYLNVDIFKVAQKIYKYLGGYIK